MKAPPFAFVRAEDLSGALKLLANPDAKAIAGGQSLLAALAFRLSQPELLVDISRLRELRGIERIGNRVRIGALSTHTMLARNAIIASDVPLLAEAARLIAHPAVRNRGTIGGSLAYADPAAELPACTIALNADIIVASAVGERRVAAQSFFTGLLTTALADGELISAVEIPVGGPDDRFAIEEVARRSGDYAMAGAAISLHLSGDHVRDARVVCFGVGDTPVMAATASAALKGQPLSDAAIASAANAFQDDLDPRDDQYNSAAMKRHLARVVMMRALSRLRRIA